MAFRIFKRLSEQLDVDIDNPQDEQRLLYDSGSGKWVNGTPSGSTGAPTDATYLVATSHADLDAEIPVGATPGGELGGTWDTPTVDATHSGSSHASVQAAAEATAAAALSAHDADTTGVHGITNTASLETTSGAQAKVDAHVNDTTDAHAGTAITNTPAGGIAATTVQAAINELDTEKAAASHVHAGEDITSGTVADARIASTIARDSEVTAAVSAHEADTTSVHGITDTSALALTADVVTKALYDANTVLAATSDNTPAAVTMGASTILARLAAGNIVAATVTEIQALLGIPVLLAETVVGSGGVASVDWQSIPATYRHLRIIGLVATENASIQGLLLRFNNDSGSNYFHENLTGTGTSATAATASSQTSGTLGNLPVTAANQFISYVIDIPYYAVSTLHTALSEWGGHLSPSNARGSSMVLYNTAAVISRITLLSGGSSDIKEGSRLALYGIP